MNKQVKDCWDQAAEAHSGDSWAEQTAFLEKFAELIVEECADVCQKLGVGGDFFSAKIREHFEINK